ncbi:hypothetical protein MANI_027263 [Metarhizium anisopliae]|nr:hypothetical protein MANI_027263 [Metarhizium anisopliae]
MQAADPQVQDEIKKLDLPPGSTVRVEPWAYATDGMNDMTQRVSVDGYRTRSDGIVIAASGYGRILSHLVLLIYETGRQPRRKLLHVNLPIVAVRRNIGAPPSSRVDITCRPQQTSASKPQASRLIGKRFTVIIERVPSQPPAAATHHHEAVDESAAMPVDDALVHNHFGV